jgi:hypothetical protein|tara:strand:- start:2047 stop:2232 length:186 start_codon:yes stop_codon:yes gene_type:complete
MKITINEKEKTMTIEVPLIEPKTSKSKKTKVIATAQGDTGEKYENNEIYISLNAYYKIGKV